MAKRYSGELQINVVYDDRGDYRTSISRGGRVLWRGRVGAPAAGYGAGIGYDSAEAYDQTAHAALSFADDERGGIVDAAELDPNGMWKIRRNPRYWEQYPGGRIRPKRFASRDPIARRQKSEDDASDLVRRGLDAEKRGELRTAAVWYRKASAAYARAGSKHRARLWLRRSDDLRRGGAEYGTLYRSPSSRSPARRAKRRAARKKTARRRR